MLNNLAEQEQWKRFYGSEFDFFNKFEISSFGNVRRIALAEGFSLKIGNRNPGRAQHIWVSNGRKTIKYKVAKLIALAFLPPCPGKVKEEKGINNYTVDFKDENRYNAKASNLCWMLFDEWVEKNKHPVRTERYCNIPGSAYSINARISPEICEQIRNEKDLDFVDIAIKYDITTTFVRNIVDGWTPKYVPPWLCREYDDKYVRYRTPVYEPTLEEVYC